MHRRIDSDDLHFLLAAQIIFAQKGADGKIGKLVLFQNGQEIPAKNDRVKIAWNEMQVSEAIQFIQRAEIVGTVPQTWADLGCGSGVFTQAIATILPAGSTVYAVDRSAQTLPKIIQRTRIIFQRADFENDTLDFSNLDGIVLANSLHYVANAANLIQRLNRCLHPINGQYLIIEYNSMQRNRWVPYPLPFTEMQKLFAAAGFTRITKLDERKSLYREGNMYACQVKR